MTGAFLIPLACQPEQSEPREDREKIVASRDKEVKPRS
jgi:hypothetical protein